MWFIRIAKIAKSRNQRSFQNRNVSRIENREIKNQKSFQKSEIVLKIETRFKNRKSRNHKSKFTSGKIDIRAGPFLSHLAFHTNKNAEIQLKTSKKNLRVLRIML